MKGEMLSNAILNKKDAFRLRKKQRGILDFFHVILRC